MKKINILASVCLLLLLTTLLPFSTIRSEGIYGESLDDLLPQALVSGNVLVPRPCIMKTDGRVYGIGTDGQSQIAEEGDSLLFGDFVIINGKPAADLKNLYQKASYFIEDLQTNKVYRLAPSEGPNPVYFALLPEKRFALKAQHAYRLSACRFVVCRNWEFEVSQHHN